MKSIFISSTFRDMQAERDALAQIVLPDVAAEAAKHQEDIDFIDLRWGVDTTELESEEGARKVLSVCLDEIEHARPYMIVLLGERYGWVPEQSLIRQAALLTPLRGGRPAGWSWRAAPSRCEGCRARGRGSVP